MTNLNIKGEVLHVYNTTAPTQVISSEDAMALSRLINAKLGFHIRVTEIEEGKGKRTRRVLIIETQ
jgi:hypothetical protein